VTLFDPSRRKITSLVLSEICLRGDQAIFGFSLSVIAITDGFSKTKYLQILWDELKLLVKKIQNEKSEN